MANTSKVVNRGIVVLVVAALVAGIAYFVLSGSDTKKVTAQFPSAVGIYQGTPVRILGVNVGEVSSVKPKGEYVEVVMEYDSKYTLPGNVGAVEVANSLVSDRYIQFAPAYSGHGPKLADGAVLKDHTSAPAELDDIYAALDKLAVALGPTGANSNGALSDLVKVGAANLKGNGTDIGNSITQLSRAAKTLAGGRRDLFSTVTNLRTFTKAISDSDKDVRKFNAQLAQVAGDLAGERTDLGAAIKLLGIALDKVNTFIKGNANKLHKDLKGLREITGILVKQRASLNETLAIGPVALANLIHTYVPSLGVIATRGNLSSLADPGQLCALLKTATNNFLPATITSLLGPLGTTVGTVCTNFLATLKPDVLTKLLTDPSLANLGAALGTALGGLGGIIGGGP